MNTFSIDINADVGEGVGNEKDLLPLLSSCNIACGGHAGDKDMMTSVVRLALENGVKIGAHPSFPDPQNFGRKVMEMSHSALYQSLKEQIETLKTIVEKEHGYLHHVKPHGALYNLIAKDERTAMVVVEVMKRFHQPLQLYVPYGSVIATIAQKEGVKITYEAFADRNYNDDLSLVSRQLSNALIVKSEDMFAHVYNMIVHQKVKTISGKEQGIKADTFCVHGDTPNALNLLKDLNMKLEDFGIKIQ